MFQNAPDVIACSITSEGTTLAQVGNAGAGSAAC
jgi:hypothetical protein